MTVSPATAGRFFHLGAALAALVFAADQLTKWWMMEVLLRPAARAGLGFAEWFAARRPIAFFVEEREAFSSLVLAPFLNFVVVWNPGVSFGLFNNHDGGLALIFIGISGLAAALMLIWMALTPRRVVALALALAVGGALGNAVDRFRFGAVADFVDLHAGGWHWPAFNLADSCIVLGAGIMMLDIWRSDKKGGAHGPW